ncbi:hypothetical protein CF319_g4913 [Tilletia indica]|nr:hypothetical protein CF319_g4913 [Tilletia indica]
MASAFSNDSLHYRHARPTQTPRDASASANGTATAELDDMQPYPIELWRARFDNFKTATTTRKVMLSALVEVTGVFLYSFFTFCAAFGVALAGAATGTPPDLPMVNLISGLVCIITVWLALAVCMPSTRGYFHPCFTVLASATGLCSWAECPVYILAQIFGAFLSSVAAIGVSWDSIRPLWDLHKAGVLPPSMIWSSSGVADVVSNFKPDHMSWGPIMLNQTALCFVMSLVVCGSLDSTNPFAAPTLAPFMVGAMFGLGLLAHINSYATDNPSLWIGGRLGCAAVFGHFDRCFPTADTFNTILSPFMGVGLGFLFYFGFLGDTRRPPAHQIVRQAEEEAHVLAQVAQKMAYEARAMKKERQDAMKMREVEFERHSRVFSPVRSSTHEQQRQHQPQQQQKRDSGQQFHPQVRSPTFASPRRPPVPPRSPSPPSAPALETAEPFHYFNPSTTTSTASTMTRVGQLHSTANKTHAAGSNALLGVSSLGLTPGSNSGSYFDSETEHVCFENNETRHHHHHQHPPRGIITTREEEVSTPTSFHPPRPTSAASNYSNSMTPGRGTAGGVGGEEVVMDGQVQQETMLVSTPVKAQPYNPNSLSHPPQYQYQQHNYTNSASSATSSQIVEHHAAAFGNGSGNGGGGGGGGNGAMRCSPRPRAPMSPVQE